MAGHSKELGITTPGKSLRLLMLALLSLSLGACANLNPLNWFDGDEEANQPVELVNIDSEVELRRLWSVRIGNGQGDNYTKLTPAVDGELIFAASEDGNVYGIELQSGDTRWRVRLETEIGGGVGAGNGMVLVGTRDAEVIALNQFTGDELWRRQVSSEVLSAPQSNGDVVVVQTVDEKLVALDAADGSQRWTYETTLPPLTLRGSSKPVISGDSVIAGFSNGTLISVAARDGVWQWEERVAVPEGRYDIDRVIDVDGDLLLDGARIFASSYQGNLMALDVASGRIVWGMPASSYHGLARGFGNIYYCDENSSIVAVRDNSDTVAWENNDLQYRAITAPTAVSNYVAVADYEGYVHLISQVDGRIVGRTRVDNDGVRANILNRGGTLYVYGNSGRLTALALQ